MLQNDHALSQFRETHKKILLDIIRYEDLRKNYNQNYKNRFIKNMSEIMQKYMQKINYYEQRYQNIEHDIEADKGYQKMFNQAQFYRKQNQKLKDYLLILSKQQKETKQIVKQKRKQNNQLKSKIFAISKQKLKHIVAINTFRKQKDAQQGSQTFLLTQNTTLEKSPKFTNLTHETKQFQKEKICFASTQNSFKIRNRRSRSFFHKQ